MKNFLVVEDNKEIRELVTGLITLQFEDITVIQAENGFEARQLLEINAFDLIVTDIQMPVMDGFGLVQFCNLQQLRVPIIAMTSDLTPEVRAKLIALGVRQCLAKPFDVSQMLKAIFQETGNKMRQTVAA